MFFIHNCILVATNGAVTRIIIDYCFLVVNDSDGSNIYLNKTSVDFWFATNQNIVILVCLLITNLVKLSISPSLAKIELNSLNVSISYWIKKVLGLNNHQVLKIYNRNILYT